METIAQGDSSRLPTKMDSNAESTVGIMTMAGKGYVIDFYLCHGYGSNFFTDTVQRVLLFIRTIWFKLSTVFTLLLGRSEDILMSRQLSRLLNLLSIID